MHAQLFLGFWIETAVKNTLFLPGGDFALFLLMHYRIVLGEQFKIRVIHEQALICFLYVYIYT